MSRVFAVLAMLMSMLFITGCTTVNTSDTPDNDGGTTTDEGYAQICAEAVQLDGTFVPAAITHNDNLFNGDCVSVDPTKEHVIKADEMVDDLIAANPTVTIAADELEHGEVRHVRFLYHSPDTKLLIVDTVHDLDVTATPIDGTIYFDGAEVGVGEATIEYDPTVNHRLTFGYIRYLVTPDDVMVDPELFPDAFMFTAVYEADENTAEVCFYPRNAETNENINAVVTVNGIELDEGENCRFVSTSDAVRGSSEYRNGLNTPQQIKIPPNILQSGSSYGYLLMYHTDALRLCVDTTPVLGEVFIVDVYGIKRSIGWPLNDEYACANVDPDTISRVEFGEVDDFETPSPSENLSMSDDGWRFETVVGLYDASQLALVCVFSAYEDEIWWIDVQEIMLDEQEFKLQYDQWSCLAVDPHVDHTITWGDATGNQSYLPPVPIIIPADTLEAGLRYDYVGEYVYDNSSSGGSRQIWVKILNDFGELQRALHDVSDDNYTHEGPETHWHGDADSVVEFLFYDEAYLLTPEPLVVDVSTLAVDDSNYNADEEFWEFEVVYHNAEPSAWVCAETLNHEGVPTDTGVEFDALRPANYSDPLKKCRVLPVGMDHQIVFYGRNGYRSPAPIYIPSGKLVVDSTKMYSAEFVFENRYATLCLGTDVAQGEIFLNGQSLGWTAVLGTCQIWAPVDITRENTVSFGDVQGFVTPENVVFNADTLGYATNTTIVGTYN